MESVRKKLNCQKLNRHWRKLLKYQVPCFTICVTKNKKSQLLALRQESTSGLMDLPEGYALTPKTISG